MVGAHSIDAGLLTRRPKHGLKRAATSRSRLAQRSEGQASRRLGRAVSAESRARSSAAELLGVRIPERARAGQAQPGTREWPSATATPVPCARNDQEARDFNEKSHAGRAKSVPRRCARTRNLCQAVCQDGLNLSVCWESGDVRGSVDGLGRTRSREGTAEARGQRRWDSEKSTVGDAGDAGLEGFTSVPKRRSDTKKTNGPVREH